MARGFAVIDLETTGFSPDHHDRIVEIAIVHVSPDGHVEGVWETLVNPQRDMGAQSIHGISASAAAQAPEFSAIAASVSQLLRGRVPVAHNASFDARFLAHAMAQTGEWCPEREFWMCTMQLAATFLPGHRSLSDCCAAIGTSIGDAHRASADALAAAGLLGAYLKAGPDRAWWDEWLLSTGDSPEPVDPPMGWVPREAASALPRPVLQRLHVAVEAADDDGSLNLDYLALLDRVLLDWHLSVTEADMLLSFAGEMGFPESAVRRMHRAYFDGLVTAAWADGELSQREWDDIQAIGRLLEIDEDVVAAASVSAGFGFPRLSTGFRLVPGDTVVITGDTRRSRSEWFAILGEAGFVARDSVSKTAKVLVAADPDSMSGKAKQARQYGIPIITENGLERLLGLE